MEPELKANQTFPENFPETFLLPSIERYVYALVKARPKQPYLVCIVYLLKAIRDGPQYLQLL